MRCPSLVRPRVQCAGIAAESDGGAAFACRRRRILYPSPAAATGLKSSRVKCDVCADYLLLMQLISIDLYMCRICMLDLNRIEQHLTGCCILGLYLVIHTVHACVLRTYFADVASLCTGR